VNGPAPEAGATLTIAAQFVVLRTKPPVFWACATATVCPGTPDPAARNDSVLGETTTGAAVGTAVGDGDGEPGPPVGVGDGDGEPGLAVGVGDDPGELAVGAGDGEPEPAVGVGIGLPIGDGFVPGLTEPPPPPPHAVSAPSAAATSGESTSETRAS